MRVTHAFTFEAAHWLPRVSKIHKCSRVHGHSYKVEFVFSGDVDERTGFVVDFFDLERMIKPLIEQLDHQTLNDVPGLDNPTAENIAIWLYNRVEDKRLARVRVYETSMCWAER